MNGEQYREYLTENIKMIAKMMYDMAEDIAGKTDGISNLNISISFEPVSLPELTITRSHLPRKYVEHFEMDFKQMFKYEDDNDESC